MNELGIDHDEVFDWSGGVDPLPDYGGGMTERALAVMRELVPDFGNEDDTDVIDLDALGFKSEREATAMRILFPKPPKRVRTDVYPYYGYRVTGSAAFWFPEDEKSGLKAKVQALIRRARDEVGDSFAALRQYVAQHASDFDTKDEVEGGPLLKRPRKDLGDSSDADPSLAPDSSASTPHSGTKAEVNEGFAPTCACEDLGVE